MKKLAIALSMLLLVGCQTTEIRADKEADTSANSKVNYINSESLKDEKNIEVPAGYNIKEFVKLSIAAYVVELKMDATKKNAPSKLDQGMPVELLGGEFSRSERFTVLTRTCTACDEEVAFQAENTVEEGAIELGQANNPDYILQMSVLLGTSTKKVNNDSGSYYAITYKSTVSAKLIDGTTKEIKHSFPPIHMNLEPKKYAESKNTGFLGGFKYFETAVSNQAYQDATALSIQVLASRVMEQFPVGGKAKNYKRNKFSLNAGSNQGIPKQGKKIPAILFLDDDGITTALASGFIIPGGSETSQFHVLKWKMSDDEAMDTKKKLDEEGKKYLKRNKIYAVSVGMPENWEL
jgi:hypothetical protein